MDTTTIEDAVKEYRDAVATGDGATVEDLCLPSATIVVCDEEGTLLKQTPGEYAVEIAANGENQPLRFNDGSEVLEIEYSSKDIAIVKQQASSGRFRFSEMLSFRKVRDGWRIAGRILSDITSWRTLSPAY